MKLFKHYKHGSKRGGQRYHVKRSSWRTKHKKLKEVTFGDIPVAFWEQKSPGFILMKAEQSKRALEAEKRHGEEAALQRVGLQQIINKEKDPRAKAYMTSLQGTARPTEEDWNVYAKNRPKLEAIRKRLEEEMIEGGI